jgi:hypothetical protein
MLGSAHDGEVLNAAKAATRLVSEARATWPEVLAPNESPVPIGEPVISAPEIGRMLSHRQCCRLNGWEVNFLAGVSEARWLSAKQAARLARITAKVERCRGGMP